MTGRLERTVVIVTSDHGEMLGERGAWYKMSCYEDSVRVPLIVRAPWLFPPGRVGRPVSTMDLMPTLTALAHGGEDPGEVTGPVDGRSLLPLLAGSQDGAGTGGQASMVTAEYLAEGASAPVVMLRSERHKFVHSPGDPDELFDLAADPGELINLAADSGVGGQASTAAGLVAAFREQVAARWDLRRLDQRIRQSQRRRLAVTAALAAGTPAPWDYGPAYDAARRYIRNHRPLGELELMARYPPAGAAVADLDDPAGDRSHWR
jgi:choline-sulfatase